MSAKFGNSIGGSAISMSEVLGYIDLVNLNVTLEHVLGAVLRVDF